eukprot:CAMPEP_0184188504 /NCGR_PEP_ID=MMETSP0976-20121227/1474_1 /TAXON_ID=483370 /ORGANISM="non described non described, Strain CCMP2097" /LENGTH=282 /DNA_ID=CAMNT_0026492831 /DNA_START=9 /DNA_END=854 /DNA_ORIENTATION=+
MGKTKVRRGRASGGLRNLVKPGEASCGKPKAKPQPVASSERSLEGAFLEAGGRAVDASAEAWRRFWLSAPKVVGIDAEGTHFEPPLLLQIATSDGVVLLESPGASLSADAARLMGDNAIAKIFFGPPECEHLGCRIRNGVDVQQLTRDAEAPRGMQRGLATVAGDYLNGKLPFVKNKQCQRSFGFHKHRFDNGCGWLSATARTYAAADAWATLRVFQEASKPALRKARAAKPVRPPQPAAPLAPGDFEKAANVKANLKAKQKAKGQKSRARAKRRAGAVSAP